MDTINDSNDTQGGTSQPLAGSKAPLDANFLMWLRELTEDEYVLYTSHGAAAVWDYRYGSGQKFSASGDAPRPGTSALGPPAPESKAGEQREPAERADLAALDPEEARNRLVMDRHRTFWANYKARSEGGPNSELSDSASEGPRSGP